MNISIKSLKNLVISQKVVRKTRIILKKKISKLKDFIIETKTQFFFLNGREIVSETGRYSVSENTNLEGITLLSLPAIKIWNDGRVVSGIFEVFTKGSSGSAGGIEEVFGFNDEHKFEIPETFIQKGLNTKNQILKNQNLKKEIKKLKEMREAISFNIDIFCKTEEEFKKLCFNLIKNRDSNCPWWFLSSTQMIEEVLFPEESLKPPFDSKKAEKEKAIRKMALLSEIKFCKKFRETKENESLIKKVSISFASFEEVEKNLQELKIEIFRQMENKKLINTFKGISFEKNLKKCINIAKLEHEDFHINFAFSSLKENLLKFQFCKKAIKILKEMKNKEIDTEKALEIKRAKEQLLYVDKMIGLIAEVNPIPDSYFKPSLLKILEKKYQKDGISNQEVQVRFSIFCKFQDLEEEKSRLKNIIAG